MTDNIPYVEKKIYVGDLEIGVKAAPFKIIKDVDFNNGDVEMVSRMIFSLKANQKQVTAKFSEIFYRLVVKVYDENGNDISNMPKRMYFPLEGFDEEILQQNGMRKLALLVYSKWRVSNADFLNVEIKFLNEFNTWTHPFNLKISVPVNKN